LALGPFSEPNGTEIRANKNPVFPSQDVVDDALQPTTALVDYSGFVAHQLSTSFPELDFFLPDNNCVKEDKPSATKRAESLLAIEMLILL
jgi:hypothetical protein